MDFSAAELAGILNGNIEGNREVKVTRISKIEEAEEGSLSFLANPAYTHYIYTTKASIVLVNKSFKPESSLKTTIIKVDDAYSSLAKLLELYEKSKPIKKGISALAFISENVKKGENIYVGEFAYIGTNCIIGNNVLIYPQAYIGDNVVIEDDSIIYPGAKIYANCKIGKSCIIHSGVVIGADGFGFSPQTEKNYRKIAQIGNVIVEDDVEIGANTTIDRATMGSTIIKKGVKLDNLIQIAHNVAIGENTVVAAQAGVAGSSKVGSNCMIGGQVGISGHLNIGNNVKMAAQAGVGANVKDDEIIMGSPAFAASKYKKTYVHFRNLDTIVRRIDELEKQIKLLNNKE
ncbi:MAG: UDP-3-O-(3-hydroxymyristoyl)glucosamine N-acyltransferase [Bacteroidetes bacterium]|nr:UDP-3-O-(3-hydroxymyristoyl)glucosamine N-acyltransferase [Bacteroidota bacterium]